LTGAFFLVPPVVDTAEVVADFFGDLVLFAVGVVALFFFFFGF